MVIATLLSLPVVAAAVLYMVNSDGLTLVDPDEPQRSYFLVFLLIALDGVMPIFPGETTLNAAATVAAQGNLELQPIIVMGALGAIVGDSGLFWTARLFSPRVQGQVTRAKSNKTVREAFELLDRSAPLLIIGGRYLPGMRFAVNASLGLSDVGYRRFLPWSILSAVLWSAYTSVLAYQIGVALGDYPLASFVISGLVSTVVIGAIILVVRRNRRKAASTGSPVPD